MPPRFERRLAGLARLWLVVAIVCLGLQVAVGVEAAEPLDPIRVARAQFRNGLAAEPGQRPPPESADEAGDPELAGRLLKATDLDGTYRTIGSTGVIGLELYGKGLRGANVSLVRKDLNSDFVEPGGIVAVYNAALRSDDRATLDQLYTAMTASLGQDDTLAAVPGDLGDRAVGAMRWGSGPFDNAMQIIVVQLDRSLVIVVVATYESPEHFDGIVRLARLAVERLTP